MHERYSSERVRLQKLRASGSGIETDDVIPMLKGRLSRTNPRSSINYFVR
jgi:hypothetical protein